MPNRIVTFNGDGTATTKSTSLKCETLLRKRGEPKAKPKKREVKENAK